MSRIKIEHAVLRAIKLPLVSSFETSFGRTSEKEALLLELRSGGIAGWGECVAGEGPFYSYEDQETAWHILADYLIPDLLASQGLGPGEAADHFAYIRGHAMAKAALEGALWDLKAHSLGEPLWRLLGGSRRRIACGVSIGIQKSVEELLERIETELSAGYRRIKVKIKPGWDWGVLESVRERFPDIPLMADANSAYSLRDANLLQALDRFDLIMVEQPLHCDDFLDHSRLQAGLSTPICLDESIRHAGDAELALELGACRIINIKMGRVGGHCEAIGIHDLCRARGVPVWCGGMLETGIGRAHNIALSTLDNFRLPGDVSAGRRYFERDTVWPPVEVSSEGFIPAPVGPGLGFEPDVDWIEHITVRRWERDGKCCEQRMER